MKSELTFLLSVLNCWFGLWIRSITTHIVSPLVLEVKHSTRLAAMWGAPLKPMRHFLGHLGYHTSQSVNQYLHSIAAQEVKYNMQSAVVLDVCSGKWPVSNFTYLASTLVWPFVEDSFKKLPHCDKIQHTPERTHMKCDSI